VSVSRIPITAEDAQDLGLPTGGGAEITDIVEGPAKAAGMRVGDAVVEFNGKPVKSSDDLVAMVVATTPGTTVPVKIVRARKSMTLNVTVEELNVEKEQAQINNAPNAPAPAPEPTETGFGMTIEGLTPNLTRRLALPSGTGGAVVSEVEQGGAAATSGIRPGDVITQINGQPIKTVDQASKALDAVAANRTARIVVFREGREVLVQVRRQ
jgi:serine protease Do